MISNKDFTITEIKELIHQLKIVFDIVRLVDPATNLVLTFVEYENKHSEEQKCYEIWGKCGACENCLSLASTHNEATRKTKYEFIGNDVFYVVSYPVKIPEIKSSEPIVLEIVSKVTDEIFFEAFGQNNIVDKITECNKIFYRDSLTGVFNRRFLDDGVFCKQHYGIIGHCAVFIMIDITKFKSINDTFGHNRGDIVLSNVGKMLNKCTRDNDIVIRYGGDEFLIILPSCNESVAEKKISYLREKVSEIIFDNEKNSTITANFGYSYCDLFYDNKNLISKLIAQADENMYKDKNFSPRTQ